MELQTKSINFKDKFRLIPIGDIHLGARACNERKLDNLIKWVVSKPDTYVIGMGDYAECIAINDKRFSGKSIKTEHLDELDDLMRAQRMDVIKKFTPLAEAGRLLGMLEGNHEYTLRGSSNAIMKDICEALDTPYLGYSCFYRLALTKGKSKDVHNVTIYAHHGWGGGRTPGAAINRSVGSTKSYEADIYLSGHDHQKMGKREVQLAISQSGTPRLLEKVKIHAKTGTFMGTCQLDSTTYSEKNGYSPADLGVVKITIELKKKNGLHQRFLDMHISE